MNCSVVSSHGILILLIMKKYDKEVIQVLLDDEEQILKDLTKNYIKALGGIKQKIKVLLAGIETTQLQSKIYQLQYQQFLEQQISEYLGILQTGNVKTVEDYLKKCYEDAFIGNVYSLQQQNIPLVLPIDQTQMIQSVMKPTEGFNFSNRLYDNISELQKVVKSEITRGIASQLSYADIARNISNYSEASMKNAYRIARTEGHRVQNESKMNAMHTAKKKGADIVKQWDATLDGRTRPNHRQLDGQIRELDEPFEVGGMKVDCPGGFGIASEDCNCRCCVLQRARWAVKSEGFHTEYLGKTENMTDEQLLPKAQKLHISVDELRKYGGQIIPIEATDYKDFCRKYKKIWNYEGSDLQKEVEDRLGKSM